MIDWTAAGQKPAGVAEILHYLQDALGSIVALTNPAAQEVFPAAPGRVVERYTYDPYGRTLIEKCNQSTGLPVERLAASRFGNPFAWTGQRYDAGVKLYHFLHRGYSPRLGRWLQRDPLGYVDGVSLYEYVRGRATSFRDPLGLAADFVDSKRLQLCISLARKINEVQEQIYRRVEDLKTDPQNLPETHPDDGQCPRLSRRGHRRLLHRYEENLNRLKTEYRNKCGGKWPRYPVPEPQPRPENAPEGEPVGPAAPEGAPVGPPAPETGPGSQQPSSPPLPPPPLIPPIPNVPPVIDPPVGRPPGVIAETWGVKAFFRSLLLRAAAVGATPLVPIFIDTGRFTESPPPSGWYDPPPPPRID